ncbi:hypothetical protein PMALA_080160 [Plasmodium malariae]|uniref:Uncharacterized protein n=1 Tax=Plasmodium malariae TaxID=5858 RepID=A0A1A8XBB3_PLAMA|nr:hypothetical protein PMALA_080160 [Plasmodium malariae]
MKGNIKYFILCNSDEYLYDRNCECIILNSRNNRILSEDKNKTIKLGYKHKLHLNKNDYLKNKKYSAESDCSGRSVSKKKYNSKFAAKSLVKKCTSVICKPYTTIYTFFEKLLYRDLIPLNGTDNFLYYLRENAKFIALSTSILSVSMVIFILVKFLKYVIEVNKNELKS